MSHVYNICAIVAGATRCICLIFYLLATAKDRCTGKRALRFPGVAKQTYKSWGSGSWRVETGHRCSHGWKRIETYWNILNLWKNWKVKDGYFVSSSVAYFTWILELQVTLTWSHLSWTGGILEMFQQDVSGGFDVHDGIEWSWWICKVGDVEKDFQLPAL